MMTRQTAAEFLKDVRLIVQTLLLLSFYAATAFYAYQKKKKRCKWEPLYIAAVGGFVNTLSFIAGDIEPLRWGLPLLRQKFKNMVTKAPSILHQFL